MEVVNIALFLLGIFTIATPSTAVKPNIVCIIADDLGWNDVSFHGSDQILTPNMDLLAYTGVAFGRYYSHAMCTPSRSAFLTGKYSHKLGMQGTPLAMSEDRGIPVNETLLPEYLRDAGYATHLVGKWHVGSSRNEFLPTSRGFDSYFGHRGGFMDYYEYTEEETYSPVGTVTGMALFKNLTAAWDVEGYITDVYTDYATSIIKNHNESTPLFLVVGHNAAHASNAVNELQAPPEEVRKQRHIESASRRMLAAVVKKLDDSIGDIVQSLYDKGILNNTIIVFFSDNGGMTSGKYLNYASNYPMRGLKLSPFEGGVRVNGLLWSANLNNTSHYWDGYIHVADWLPTLLSAAGIDVPSDIDGINQWDNINSNAASNRTVMYEIDDIIGYGSVTYNELKLVNGTVTPSYSTHQGSDLQGIIGDPPSYTDAILNSTVYSVLESLGTPFDTANLSLRNNTVIQCNVTSINTTSLCFPDNDTVCLYNIIEDPCEITDLSDSYPELVSTMKAMLEEEAATRIARTVPVYKSPLAAPSLFNYTWDVFVADSS